MAQTQELMGLGFGALEAGFLGQVQQEALVSAGSTRADATTFTASLAVFATVGSSEGAVLPLAAAQQQNTFFVKNNGSNALSMYATGSDTINGVAGSTAYSIPASEGAMFVRTLAGTGWISFPMGT